ncbi:MAG: energy transducer TonB [Flavobacteriales bacterium]|nr:energy transducer TonB [Flavobacteriales bacterium]
MSKRGYLAIIISLSIHVVVLSIVHLVTRGSDMVESQQEDKAPIEVQLLAMTIPQELELTSELDDIRNLTANENAELTSEARDFSSRSKKQAAEDIYNDLKSLEQQVLDQLAQERAAKGNPESNVELPEQSDEDREDYEWYDQKSYDGKVTASYNLEGRDDLEIRKPTYRCRNSGTVVVEIEVNQNGLVTDARVSEAGTTTNNECLLDESVKYALMCRFNSSLSAPRKQKGTISYTFVPQ